jgi:hypothetical protein
LSVVKSKLPRAGLTASSSNVDIGGAMLAVIISINCETAFKPSARACVWNTESAMIILS